MQHTIDPQRYGPLGEPMAGAVQSCVHCGFCLAACPTYQELGQEMDSPRGRILLMKEVLEGGLSTEAALPYVDQCLGCLACEPACPSGVAYRDLISPFRSLAEPHRKRPFLDRARRTLVSQMLPFPSRFRLGAQLGRLGKMAAPLVPGSFRPMLDLLPERIPSKVSWPEINPARGTKRARVALLLGCAQRVLDPDINTATIDILTRHGVEVVVPPSQGCCGALSWHVGDLAAAQKFAVQNLKAFADSRIDAVITNAAGCGSGLHEYHLILKGTRWEEQAEAFRRRVLDVTVFLHRLGDLESIPEPSSPITVAYHDACHLANAQGVVSEPRSLLRRIPGLKLVEVAEGHLCCGSAGTYNIDQPEIANSLGRQKAEALAATGAELIATGNIGCLTQIKTHLDRLGVALPIRHTVQILRDAYCSHESSRGDAEAQRWVG